MKFHSKRGNKYKKGGKNRNNNRSDKNRDSQLKRLQQQDILSADDSGEEFSHEHSEDYVAFGEEPLSHSTSTEQLSETRREKSSDNLVSGNAVARLGENSSDEVHQSTLPTDPVQRIRTEKRNELRQSRAAHKRELREKRDIVVREQRTGIADNINITENNTTGQAGKNDKRNISISNSPNLTDSSVVPDSPSHVHSTQNSQSQQSSGHFLGKKQAHSSPLQQNTTLNSAAQLHHNQAQPTQRNDRRDGNSTPQSVVNQPALPSAHPREQRVHERTNERIANRNTERTFDRNSQRSHHNNNRTDVQRRDNQRSTAQQFSAPFSTPSRPKSKTLRRTGNLLHSVEPNKELRAFYKKIEKYILTELALEDYSTIVIGVSGGVDSVVLLDVLSTLSAERGYRIIVAHYNHSLRGHESLADAEFVRHITAKLALQYYTETGNVREFATKSSLSIEQAARELRYNFISDVAKRSGAAYIALAHTSDDNAETFLLNLFRGSGLTGLSSIPARRLFTTTCAIVRPFLGISKKDVLAYAQLKNLSWREDSTNVLTDYTRNKIRHEVLPQIKDKFNPSIADTLNRTARLLRGAEETIAPIVKNVLKNAVIATPAFTPGNRLVLSVDVLQTQNEFLRGEVLQEATRKFFRIQGLSLETLDRISSLLSAETGTKVTVSRKIVAVRDRTSLAIFEEKATALPVHQVTKSGRFEIPGTFVNLSEVERYQVKFNASSGSNVISEFLDSDTIPYRLELRPWKAGDTFQPLGMKGSMLVSDFLTNSKVSVFDRANTYVLATKDGEIVSIIGYRISEKYKVTSSTQRALKIDSLRR